MEALTLVPTIPAPAQLGAARGRGLPRAAALLQSTSVPAA